MTPFSAAYYGLCFLLYLFSLPILIILSFKRKYRRSIPARFFLWKNPAFEEKGVWIHACSLGEVASLQPILEKLEGRVNLSVITQTGFQKASKVPNAQVRYLPFEVFLPLWVRRQKVLAVMEAELWYMLFVCARSRGGKTMLINARISDRSYPKYKKFAWFYKRLFRRIDLVFAQSAKDKKRLMELGARRVEVTGNIKTAMMPTVKHHYEKPKGLTTTAASTHDTEEELILHAFSRFRQGRLIIVPRHPERFDEVAFCCQKICQKEGFSFHRFSESRHFDSDVILLDLMGELVNIYAISDIVVIGGAFAKIGGHNPIEPAHFGCRIITGKHFFNLVPLFENLEHCQIVENTKLSDALANAMTLPKTTLKQTGDVDRIVQSINQAHAA